MNALTNGSIDIVELLLTLLERAKARYCVIGGLAVNAYADPVVSLDLDIVDGSESVGDLCDAATQAGIKIEESSNGVNLSSDKSSLRIQIQTDPRYQPFLDRAAPHTVLGYELRVAHVEDVLAGKVWAYLDPARRASKRQKDLADIMRLVETRPELRSKLPDDMKAL